MGVFGSLLYSNFIFDYVVSGCVWSGDSYGVTLNASMTAGTALVNGQYFSISAVSARPFTASKDTYIDINSSGVLVYTEVTNNAASPALAANSIRIGIIVTGAGSIAAATSVNQGQETMVLPIASSIPYAVTDSLGNLICPRDPNRRVLGYRQIITTFNAGTNATTDVTGLSSPVIVPTGRKIKIIGEGALLTSGTARDAYLRIYEGATNVSFGAAWTGGASVLSTAHTEYQTSPTAGLHTYKIAINCDVGANVSAFGDPTGPVFIRIELE